MTHSNIITEPLNKLILSLYMLLYENYQDTTTPESVQCIGYTNPAIGWIEDIDEVTQYLPGACTLTTHVTGAGWEHLSDDDGLLSIVQKAVVTDGCCAFQQCEDMVRWGIVWEVGATGKVKTSNSVQLSTLPSLYCYQLEHSVLSLQRPQRNVLKVWPSTCASHKGNTHST